MNTFTNEQSQAMYDTLEEILDALIDKSNNKEKLLSIHERFCMNYIWKLFDSIDKEKDEKVHDEDCVENKELVFDI